MGDQEELATRTDVAAGDATSAPPSGGAAPGSESPTVDEEEAAASTAAAPAWAGAMAPPPPPAPPAPPSDAGASARRLAIAGVSGAVVLGGAAAVVLVLLIGAFVIVSARKVTAADSAAGATVPTFKVAEVTTPGYAGASATGTTPPGSDPAAVETGSTDPATTGAPDSTAPGAPGASTAAPGAGPTPAGPTGGSAGAVPGVLVVSNQPANPTAARRAIREAFATVYTGPVDIGPKLAVVDNSGDLSEAMRKLAEGSNGPWAKYIDVSVEDGNITFDRPDHANVTYQIKIFGKVVTNNGGDAVEVGGVWKLTRATVCQDMKLAGNPCP